MPLSIIEWSSMAVNLTIRFYGCIRSNFKTEVIKGKYNVVIMSPKGETKLR